MGYPPTWETTYGPLIVNLRSERSFYRLRLADPHAGGSFFARRGGNLDWRNGETVTLSLTAGAVKAQRVDVSDTAAVPGKKDGEIDVSWKVRQERGTALNCSYQVQWRPVGTSDNWQWRDFHSYSSSPTHTIRRPERGEDCDVRLLVTPPKVSGQSKSASIVEAIATGTSGQHSNRGNFGVVQAPPQLALSVADAQAAEGESLSFAVTLDAAVTGPVTVDWVTLDGTATADADYEGATGALSFAVDETSNSIADTEPTPAPVPKPLTARSNRWSPSASGTTAGARRPVPAWRLAPGSPGPSRRLG